MAAIAGCSGNSGPAYDAFGAYNALGGAGRSNDFSGVSSAPVGNLVPMAFGSLGGGFLAPPLELQYGRMALLSRSDSATNLAIVLRDTVLHRFRFPQQEHPMPSLAADSAGTVYAVTTRGILSAFDGEGKQLWRKETFAGIPPERIAIPAAPLALKDGVLLGNSEGTLARYDRAGKELWSTRRGGSLGTFFAADPALGAVIGITRNDYDLADSISVVDLVTGAAHWTKSIPGGRIIYGPVLVGELIVVGAARRGGNDLRTPSLVAFRRDGAVAWQLPLLLMPRGISGDATGNLYVACAGVSERANGGALISVDPAGKKRWEANFESGLPAPPLVSAEWIYFISRREGRTGLFTYGRDGVFHSFVSVDAIPDVLSLMTLSSYGEPFLVGVDQPALVRGE